MLLTELTCFYLSSQQNLVVSGCCTDPGSIQKIFQILHFNIVIIISTDISNLKKIVNKVKKNASGKKIILITSININRVKKHIPYVKSFDIISMEEKIDSLEKSLANTAQTKGDGSLLPTETKAYTILSDREKEILRLIFLGKKNKEIADKLFLSVKTIENHRNNILKKTNSRSMIYLLNYLFRLGFFTSHNN